MIWDPPVDLVPVLTFLDRFSWVFSFQWIDPNEESAEVQGLQSAMEKIPTHWVEPLTCATFGNLKALILGLEDNYTWPQDLRQFASECRRFTAIVSQNVCLLPTMFSQPTLMYNPSANCVDFLPNERVPNAKQLLHITSKKSHEVARMTAFLRHLLCNRNLDCDEDAFSDRSTGTFQTSPLLSLRKCQTKHGIYPSCVVDIGSGLGHLPNLLAQCLVQETDTNAESFPFRVCAVDCDPVLDQKARLMLQRPDRIGVEKRSHVWSQTIRRLLFCLTESNTMGFTSLLNESLNPEVVSSHSNWKQTSTYLLSGLHCCGDLSHSVTQLFEDDVRAEWVVLVGCCYHKMTLKQFPTSDRLRVAFKSVPNLMRSFCSKATFRLACQWSPCIWLSWTDRDCNVHRVRLISRILSPAGTRKFDPIKNCPELHSVLDLPGLDFNRVLSMIPQISCPSKRMPYLTAVWNLSPGLLALQQLLQPLLEIIILADRVWRLRTDRSRKPKHMFTGLVRLFDPKISPRCMALVACKSWLSTIADAHNCNLTEPNWNSGPSHSICH